MAVRFTDFVEPGGRSALTLRPEIVRLCFALPEFVTLMVADPAVSVNVVGSNAKSCTPSTVTGPPPDAEGLELSEVSAPDFDDELEPHAANKPAKTRAAVRLNDRRTRGSFGR